MRGCKSTCRWVMKVPRLYRKALLLVLCGLLASGCSLISAPEVTSTLAVAPSATVTAFPSPASSIDRGDVNLAHLNFLVEDVDIAGQPMAISHIYSEYR